jgi:hypothetical protein
MPSPSCFPFGLALLELPGKGIDAFVGDVAGGVEKLACGLQRIDVSLTHGSVELFPRLSRHSAWSATTRELFYQSIKSSLLVASPPTQQLSLTVAQKGGAVFDTVHGPAFEQTKHLNAGHALLAAKTLLKLFKRLS